MIPKKVGYCDTCFFEDKRGVLMREKRSLYKFFLHFEIDHGNVSFLACMYCPHCICTYIKRETSVVWATLQT